MRMPPELHGVLAELAKKERRTLNEQIVYLLERAVGKSGASR